MAKDGKKRRRWFEENRQRLEEEASRAQAPIEEPAESPELATGQALTPEENVRVYADLQGLAPDDFLDAAELVHQGLKEDHASRREVKRHAHELTGLSAPDMARVENSGLDFAAAKKAGGKTGGKLAHFDEYAAELVADYPEVFGTPDDASRAVWDLLREPAEAELRMDDPKVLTEAEAMVRSAEEPAPVGPQTVFSKSPARGTAAGGMAAAGTGTGYGQIEPTEKAAPRVAENPEGAPEMESKTPKEAFAEETKPGALRSALNSVLSLVAPGRLEKQAARTIRQTWSEMKHSKVVAYEDLSRHKSAFWSLGRDQQIDFMDRMEKGEAQPDSQLNEAASALREALDAKAKEIQDLGTGKLHEVIENYFPHIWTDPEAARDIYAQIIGKRPMEGSKAFLKARSIMTIREGVENRGLEPVSYNPVDLALLKLWEMDRYIYAQKLIQRLKDQSLVRFVYARSTTPEGYRPVNDKLFQVYMPPEMKVSEAFDQLMIDNLQDFARSMGIDTQRVMKMRANRWGEASESPEKVTTRFAGPESVLIHEIGHVLGFRYRLHDWMTKGNSWINEKRHKNGKPVKAEAQRRRVRINRELRALADARFEDQEASPGFRRYVRKKPEKEAVMLEAFLHAPEKMQRVAPTVYDQFTKFLNDNAELRPLLDVKPSLTLGSGEGTLEVPGVTKLGQYMAPEGVARLLNNHLAPGLRSNENQLVSGGYDLVRKLGNTMNQAQLVSLFHGLFTSISVPTSYIGQGIRNVFAPGMVARGMVQLASAPASPIVNLRRGRQLRKAYRKNLDEIEDPQLRHLVEALIVAGGRAEADAFYLNQASEHWVDTVGDLVKGAATALGPAVSSKARARAAGKLPFLTFSAALEGAMTPVMKHLVPTQKLGMFAMMASDEMARLKTDNLSDPVLAQRLTEVWDSIENRLGQLDYDNLFWHKTLKDASMLSVRAVGWNLGFLREYAIGAPLDVITTSQRLKAGDALISIRTAELAGTVFALSILGAVVQYAMTGERPEETKDFFFPRTGNFRPDGSPERLSLPNYAKDLYGWITRPGQTAKHKLHPMWAMVADILTNQDFYGTEIRHQDDPVVQQALDVAEYIAKEFTPFSYRNWEEMRKSGNSPGKAAFVAATGITEAPSYVTQSPAQRLMARYINARIPRGTRTKDAFQKSDLRRQAKNRMRLGQPLDMLDLHEHFTDSEIERIYKEAAMPPFVESFKRLSIDEAINVYLIASDKERGQVHETLLGKWQNALSCAERSSQYTAENWETMGGLMRQILEGDNAKR